MSIKLKVTCNSPELEKLLRTLESLSLSRGRKIMLLERAAFWIRNSEPTAYSFRAKDDQVEAALTLEDTYEHRLVIPQASPQPDSQKLLCPEDGRS